MRDNQSVATIILAIIIITVLTAVVILEGFVGSLQVEDKSSLARGLGWLRTNGTWIVDGEGNIVSLRGANFMGYEFGAWNVHTEEDYKKMASWGFKVVRLPIAWHFIEFQQGALNSSYLERLVDRDIAWAKKYGIYIILDMHQWYWSPYFTFFGSRGNGMPTWMVSGYQDSVEGLNQARTDFWLGKAPNGTIASQKNPSMQDRFIAVWKYIATRYGDEPTIAAYDLFNEPPRGLLTPREHAVYLYAFYEKLMFEIRQVDPYHILIYEPTGAYATDVAKLLNYPNIAFSFHFYEERFNYAGIQTDLVSSFYQFWSPVEDWSIPVIVGEFNTHVDVPNATLWMQDVLSIFKEYQLGWAWWTYYKSDYPAALCYTDGRERTEFTDILKYFVHYN